MEGRPGPDDPGRGRKDLSAGADTPLFSIGVTTYDRVELLRETLASILRQDFRDFEILVGNDNPARRLDASLLNAADPRVRIVNRPANLGELGNMNALLAEARGRYFSWLADDDLYACGILSAVAAAVAEFGGPSCVYTLYTSLQAPAAARQAPTRRVEAAEFLRAYLARRLPVLGCCGFYERAALLDLGGMTPLGPGISPYSDNLLALRSALLRPVVIDQPLIHFRLHEQSLSYSSVDLAAYRVAQESLWSRFARDILPLADVPSGQRGPLLSALLSWCVRDFFGIMGRSGRGDASEMRSYMRFLHKALPESGGLTSRAAMVTFAELVKLPLRVAASRALPKSA